MKLIDEWRIVLNKAWSVKFQVIAALFSALEVALPLVKPDGTSNNVFAILAGVTTLLAIVARVLAQKEIPK